MTLILQNSSTMARADEAWSLLQVRVILGKCFNQLDHIANEAQAAPPLSNDIFDLWRAVWRHTFLSSPSEFVCNKSSKIQWICFSWLPCWIGYTPTHTLLYRFETFHLKAGLLCQTTQSERSWWWWSDEEDLTNQLIQNESHLTFVSRLSLSLTLLIMPSFVSCLTAPR